MDTRTEPGMAYAEQLIQEALHDEKKARIFRMQFLQNNFSEAEENAMLNFLKSYETKNAKSLKGFMLCFSTYETIKDLETGARLNQEAINLNDMPALHDRASMPEDYRRAPVFHPYPIEWYYMAAEGGYAPSIGEVGKYCHYHRYDPYHYDLPARIQSISVEKRSDSERYLLAKEWYEKAAEQMDPVGLNGLGELYKFGQGVEQDLFKSLEYYKKAASSGYREALENYLQMAVSYMPYKMMNIDYSHEQEMENLRFGCQIIKEHEIKWTKNLVTLLNRYREKVIEFMGTGFYFPQRPELHDSKSTISMFKPAPEKASKHEAPNHVDANKP